MEKKHRRISTFSKGILWVIQALSVIVMSISAIIFQVSVNHRLFMHPAFIVMFIAVVIWIVCLGYMTIGAGYTVREDKIKLYGIDYFPVEILVAIIIAVLYLTLKVFYRSQSLSYQTFDRMVIVSSIGMILEVVLVVGYLSIIRRCKAKVMAKSSIIYSIIHALTSGSADIFSRRSQEEKILLDEVKRIANGDLQYTLDPTEFHGELREIAEGINSVRSNIQKSIDEKVDDERMKAAMITNISHDIKTPLTSIISYISILQRMNIEDEQVKEYIKILDKKAFRLKDLLEDFLEISRISSGNIVLSKDPIDFAELVRQTGGEFNEKLEEKYLQVITKVPNNPVIVMADGKQLWRVIGNLYNNAAKYSLEGTRLYVEVVETEYQVFFVMKNISKNPISVNPEELTERFIRGDVSRSTEGSGLGLSISKMLTEMMGGTLMVRTDGNVFTVKVILNK